MRERTDNLDRSTVSAQRENRVVVRAESRSDRAPCPGASVSMHSARLHPPSETLQLPSWLTNAAHAAMPELTMSKARSEFSEMSELLFTLIQTSRMSGAMAEGAGKISSCPRNASRSHFRCFEVPPNADGPTPEFPEFPECVMNHSRSSVSSSPRQTPRGDGFPD